MCINKWKHSLAKQRQKYSLLKNYKSEWIIHGDNPHTSLPISRRCLLFSSADVTLAGSVVSLVSLTGNWTAPIITHTAGNIITLIPNYQRSSPSAEINIFEKKLPRDSLLALLKVLNQCNCRKYNFLLYLDRIPRWELYIPSAHLLTGPVQFFILFILSLM